MLSSVWPLFELRIETPRLLLRVPGDRDLPGLLSAIDAGIHDPEVMPFQIPWTDLEPEARRRSAVQHWWSERAMWTPEDWQASFAVFLDGRPVGIQTIGAKAFAMLGEVSTGSWLTSLVQGKGLGKEMRAAVLQLAFEGLGAELARSGAFTHNEASIGVSRALGYRENGRKRLAPRGAPQVLVEFELSRHEWMARCSSWPQARISGLEPCLEMFGPAVSR
jgi:RimJ/RimL family protein N-acetyltransferase